MWRKIFLQHGRLNVTIWRKKILLHLELENNEKLNYAKIVETFNISVEDLI